MEIGKPLRIIEAVPVPEPETIPVPDKEKEKAYTWHMWVYWEIAL